MELRDIIRHGMEMRMTMELMEQQPFLKRLAQGGAALFGPNCEVAVHDLTQ